MHAPRVLCVQFHYTSCPKPGPKTTYVYRDHGAPTQMLVIVICIVLLVVYMLANLTRPKPPRD